MKANRSIRVSVALIKCRDKGSSKLRKNGVHEVATMILSAKLVFI